MLSALSCGAACPVAGLDILHLSDESAASLIPALTDDLNRAHTLFSDPDNASLFPSSFLFQSFRPVFPTLNTLVKNPASAALLDALRGKGIPLSYKTDAEAVDLAFSFLLSDRGAKTMEPFETWCCRIREALDAGSDARICVLCDLCDPFSAGAVYAVLPYLREYLGSYRPALTLFCLARRSAPADDLADRTLHASLAALDERGLVSPPDGSRTAPADSAWFMSLPASFTHNDGSWRLVYLAAARQMARFFTSAKLPAPGLHTASLPGVITLHALGDQAKPFAAFLFSAVWLLSDLLPALSSFISHAAPLRTLAPNTRGGLFKRLFRPDSLSAETSDTVRSLDRVLRAVIAEVLGLVCSVPDPLRLAEVGDRLWNQAVDACGRTVTVAAEHDVFLSETEEAGVLEMKPVHRVSLADTEEEKQIRRLEDISAQLEEETEKRDRLFAALGTSLSLLVLRDCRERCRQAIVRAREQFDALVQDPAAEHLAVASLSRRISLLNAAVSRCNADLSDQDLLRRIAQSPPEPDPAVTPFSGEMFSSAAAEKLSSLLSADAEHAETVRKELRALLPDLFCGFRLPEIKQLFRTLLSVCKPADEKEQPPVTVLGLSVLSVCAQELADAHFVPVGSIPPIPLLPDLYPEQPPLTLSALLPLLLSLPDVPSDARAAKRGLLAFLMLRQYRRRSPEEASLLLESFSASDSPLLHSWLSSRGADRLWIASLKNGEEQFPFALILPGLDLLPARMSSAHAAMVPAFALPWFDEETPSFRDPSRLLCGGDRAVLSEQLRKMSDALDEGAPLRGFLRDYGADLLREDEAPELPDDFELRLKAAYGLRLLPAFASLLVRSPVSYEHLLSEDPLASSLLGVPSFPASACNVPDDILFLYRGVPFARESAKTLLEGIPIPAESWILSLLGQECATLSRASDDYHDALVRELSLLLERCPDALPKAREKALALLEKAAEPIEDSVTELAWPWDPLSPSVRTILAESLGAELVDTAVQPFSDCLALFPARGSDVIGDALLASMCVLPPPVVAEGDEQAVTVSPDAVLPPLSPEFAVSLCRRPEGRALVRQGFLSFERMEGNELKAILTLEGSFTVRLVRVYGEDEIHHLYSHDIPTLAVWPNLPFAPEDWSAYFVYASMPETFSVSYYTAETGPIRSGEETSRYVSRSAAFPLSFSFFRGGLCLGSLLNLLPPPETRKEDTVTACVDFGSVGTSVVLASGQRRRPLQGPTLVRTLLNNPAVSRTLLRREFLPAVPVSALLPTASRIFRNVPGAAPLPFEDGIVLMSADLQDVLSIPSGALYTCLKWEEEKGRSVSLCLHQIMLMTALQARTDGAASLAWRFAVPDEMAKAGREKLAELFASLALQVNQAAGFPVPQQGPPVAFAAESSALGAYFRFCASEDTRGGFMVLDIGASTADISLFLRGREQAVRTCQIPLGIHYMLLPTLLSDPGILSRDLGYYQDPAFLQDLSLLEQILRNARVDSSSLRHSRLALDNFIADRYALLLSGLLCNPMTGMPTRLGSILLLYFSYLMMLSGLILLQIAADPAKNDFLPEQMSLCLSGRGSLLLEGLPDPVKAGLWHFLTMFRNRRVASLSLLFSSEKKMEIPVGLSVLSDVSAGLPPASAVPAAISVRPEELLPQFLLRFRKEFPASAEVLFHGFFTDDFYHPFSSYGESLVSAAISQSFTDQTALRPFDSLSAWISTLLELISSASL